MHPDARDDDRRITYFAATHTRGKREMFGIRAIDRGKHVYVIGKTGMGKSTLLENMAIQDIQHGEGIAFIDPHGSTAEKLLDFVPHDRINDVVYFAPFDVDYPIGFNVMEDVGFDKRHLVVSGLMGALKRIWVDAWSARMEYILQNTLLALLEYPGSTLLDVNRMLTNKTFREAVIKVVQDPIVKAFWTEEFAAFTDTYTREATPAIQNKIGQFIANPLIRNIIGQSKSSFDLRQMMDEKKIFIVNLSKGRMGETNASLLGSMLTVKIYLAAMSRAEEPAARMVKLPRCFFYVDEFQSMMNESFADILSESRKYKLALTLANQYIEQMEEGVRDAVFGNVGTLITFRVGPFDAETLKTVFEPTFEAEDLVGLGIGQIYLTLMIDGVGSPPFSAETIPPIESPHISYREDVVTHSRDAYGRPREEVEAVIAAKQKEFIPPPVLSKSQIRKNESGSSYGTRPRAEAPVVPPIAIMRATSALPESRQAPAPITVPVLPPAPAPAASVAPTATPIEREVGRPPQPLTSIPRPREYVVERSIAHQPQRTPQKSTAEADQRSALRAAIQGARQISTPPASAPIRSPADLLRARVQNRAVPSSMIKNRQPESATRSFRSTDFRSVRPPQPPREPELQPVHHQEQSSMDESISSDEISPELLKRVIHEGDDRGHEDT
jgi:energy-coupling factor transporter ATP-binding protein EcfA2